jgi:hypothetical protein
MDVKMNSNRTTKRIKLFMVDLDCVLKELLFNKFQTKCCLKVLNEVIIGFESRTS